MHWGRNVDVVQLEQRRPEIRNRFGILLTFQARGRVKGQIVIKKLTEESKACAQVRVVGVVQAFCGIGDRCNRVTHVIPGVHDAARHADVIERLSHRRRIGRECRECGEQPAELALTVVG